jgi:hypothetical protein
MANEVRIKLTEEQKAKIKAGTGKDLPEIRVGGLGPSSKGGPITPGGKGGPITPGGKGGPITPGGKWSH